MQELKNRKEHCDARRFSDKALLFGLEYYSAYEGHNGQPVQRLLENPDRS